ncbi:hypothetical protein [Buchananella hordeovulneris]|uniref:hypothetical protein n=1 Tax=Buchananella hordeovulneris TaxID=52770 RepID=UPI001160EBA8|nr:hypothetical protein [Buchananella hordeovulneris]
MSEPVISKEAIAALKIAAIDAYMSDQNYGRQGDVYMHFDGNDYEGCYYEVFAPDEEASGGGERFKVDFSGGVVGAREYLDSDFSKAFMQIKNGMDEILKPWMSMPEEADVDAVLSRFAGLMNGVSNGAGAGSSVAEGGAGDEIDLTFPEGVGFVSAARFWSDFDSMKNTERPWLGLSGTAFRTKFVEGGKVVAENICAALGACGCVIAAEKGAVVAVRRALPEIVGKVTEAFKSQSPVSIPLEAFLSVVKLARAAFKLFVDVNVGNLIAVGDAVVDADKHIGEAGGVSVSGGGSYEQTVSVFVDLLQELSDKVLQVEKGCETYLNKLASYISMNVDRYDISVQAITLDQVRESKDVSAEYSPETIDADCEHMDKVARSHMPPIAAAFKNLYATGIDLGFHGAIARDARIGLGQYGAAHKFSEVAGIILDYAKEFGDEMESGSKMLLAVSREFRRTEEQQQEKYDDLKVTLEEAIGDFKEKGPRPDDPI